MAQRRFLPRRPLPAFRRVLRRRRPTRWTANVDLDGTVIPVGNSLEIAITDEGVYRQNQFIEASLATAVRAVGNVVLFSGAGDTLIVNVGLFRLDSDDPSPNMQAVDNYINERMLWSMNIAQRPNFSGDTVARELHVDWKGAAAMQSGRLSLVLQNQGAGQISCAWALRALLAGVF